MQRKLKFSGFVITYKSYEDTVLTYLIKIFRTNRSGGCFIMDSILSKYCFSTPINFKILYQFHDFKFFVKFERLLVYTSKVCTISSLGFNFVWIKTFYYLCLFLPMNNKLSSRDIIVSSPWCRNTLHSRLYN